MQISGLCVMRLELGGPRRITSLPPCAGTPSTHDADRSRDAAAHRCRGRSRAARRRRFAGVLAGVDRTEAVRWQGLVGSPGAKREAVIPAPRLANTHYRTFLWATDFVGHLRGRSRGGAFAQRGGRSGCQRGVGQCSPISPGWHSIFVCMSFRFGAMCCKGARRRGHRAQRVKGNG